MNTLPIAWDCPCHHRNHRLHRLCARCRYPRHPRMAVYTRPEEPWWVRLVRFLAVLLVRPGRQRRWEQRTSGMGPYTGRVWVSGTWKRRGHYRRIR